MNPVYGNLPCYFILTKLSGASRGLAIMKRALSSLGWIDRHIVVAHA